MSRMGTICKVLNDVIQIFVAITSYKPDAESEAIKSPLSTEFG